VSGAGATPGDSGSTGWFGRLLGAAGQRPIDQLGRGTVLAGRPHVVNDGLIRIGEGCHLGSHPIQSHMIVMTGASILIGNQVSISYGAAMSAQCSIAIGDNTRIGPFCVMIDNDFHKVGDRNIAGLAAPIEIGRGVTIGARVTILRGTCIGDGASIMSGSTVIGVVPSGAVVSGVPARPASKGAARKIGAAVTVVIMNVFRLAALPGPQDQLARLPGWAPRGCVRLLLALEEVFGVTLSDRQLRAAASVADVTRLIVQATKTSHRTGAAPRPA
jgi:acetyltransferase-like isoleucine patch superfamily enzyme